MKNRIFFNLILFIMLNFFMTSCYSVFSGGTGGIVVDAESTSNPKSGIANVDVYAYTSESDRNSDYDSWSEGTVFSPAASYYGHTSTGTDGSFTISKMVWKNSLPEFGKDADVSVIYLLFYHENYGLTKGSTLIVSDSTSSTVYQELTAVRKTTAVTFTFMDVATSAQTTQSVYVSVSVPQTTETLTSASPKVYEQQITGTGTINISYPRWTSAANKTAGTENSPSVTIRYYQSASEVTWKGCYNADNSAGNYAFRADGFSITQTIPVCSSYALTYYGKPTRFTVPTFSGKYGDGTSSSSDGLVVKLSSNSDGGSNYSVDCGETTTYSQTVGTSNTIEHGMFSSLGGSTTWEDTSYTGRYATLDVKLSVQDGASEVSKTMTVRSNVSSYTVQL